MSAVPEPLRAAVLTEKGVHGLTTTCPKCGERVSIEGKIAVDHTRPGGRTNTLMATCYEHGIVDRMVIRWEPRPVDDGQRWHVVATEGLPPAPDGTWFLIYCPNREPEIQQAQIRDGGVWDLMDREFSQPGYERDATHWHPMPAPPTREPR